MVCLRSALVSTIALAALTCASPAPAKRAMSVHERKELPAGFKRVAKAKPETTLTLRLALKQSDAKGLIDALYRISDPKSASYGQHLSTAEVNAFMAPTPVAAAAAGAWLAENGIVAAPVSPAGDWLEFRLPVSRANALFAADFTVFRHAASNTTGTRTLQYSIPTALQSSIALLFPGVSFWNPAATPKFEVQDPVYTRAEKRQGIPASCTSTITPACLQALYGIPATPATVPTNQIAVSGFIEEYANQADLTQFLSVNRPDIANATFSTQLLDGGVNPQTLSQAGLEANLDVQYTVGVATGVPTVFISVGEDQQPEDEVFGFLDIINFLIGEDNQPQVLTTSYGANEGDLSPELQDQLCNAYAALGAKGTSILFASGDGGVAGSRNNPCDGDLFVPTFPSGCPYITTVGATTGIPETAADFSSGGFSNVFAQPDYQATAVTSYFAEIGDLNAGLYNATGRGFPDVSAMGDNVLITWTGLTGTVSGTSCSSPIFASVIGLINDRRAVIGLPPLGFLNPFLYANPQAFSDITTGSNPGCNTDGFPALSGWDPVTGLGTPIFDALAAAAGV